MWPKRQVTLQCRGLVLYHVFCAVWNSKNTFLSYFIFAIPFPRYKGTLTVQSSTECGSPSHCSRKLTIPTKDRSLHVGMMYVFFYFWQRTLMRTTPTREWRWCGSSSVNTAANCASLAPNSRATCPSPTPVSITMHVHSVADSLLFSIVPMVTVWITGRMGYVKTGLYANEIWKLDNVIPMLGSFCSNEPACELPSRRYI